MSYNCWIFSFCWTGYLKLPAWCIFARLPIHRFLCCNTVLLSVEHYHRFLCKHIHSKVLSVSFIICLNCSKIVYCQYNMTLICLSNSSSIFSNEQNICNSHFSPPCMKKLQAKISSITNTNNNVNHSKLCFCLSV